MTGPAIREARTRLGLSQGQLATLCGWESHGRIADYERGHREPSPKSVAVLETVFAGRQPDVVRKIAKIVLDLCEDYKIAPEAVAVMLRQR